MSELDEMAARSPARLRALIVRRLREHGGDQRRAAYSLGVTSHRLGTLILAVHADEAAAEVKRAAVRLRPVASIDRWLAA